MLAKHIIHWIVFPRTEMVYANIICSLCVYHCKRIFESSHIRIVSYGESAVDLGNHSGV